jgi:hypothetical protein
MPNVKIKNAARVISKKYGTRCSLAFRQILEKSPNMDPSAAFRKARAKTFHREYSANGREIGALRFNSP